MKQYIFLTPAIGCMGGNQMYLSNKIEFLEDNGWVVNVFYSLKFDKIVLNKLKTYEENFVNELQYGFYTYPAYKVRAVIDSIKSKIPRCEEIVIESHMFGLSFWGELLASEIGAKHIMNPLEEKTPVPTAELSDFLYFKLTHGGLLNASPQSLKRFFGDYYSDELLQYSFIMNPICSNTVSDIDFDIEINKAGFNILSIGRLDKPYVIPMIKEVVSFAQSNVENHINLIIIGASPEEIVEKEIVKETEEHQNIDVYFLGYMFPVPQKLIQMCDVSIATSNSVLPSADFGIPTIAVDALDFYAIGIYKLTTRHRCFRKDEPKIKVSQLLNDILIEKKYTHISGSTSDSVTELLRPQLNFLDRSKPPYEYYNIYRIISPFRRFWFITKRYIRRLLGICK